MADVLDRAEKLLLNFKNLAQSYSGGGIIAVANDVTSSVFSEHPSDESFEKEVREVHTTTESDAYVTTDAGGPEVVPPAVPTVVYSDDRPLTGSGHVPHVRQSPDFNIVPASDGQVFLSEVDMSQSTTRTLHTSQTRAPMTHHNPTQTPPSPSTSSSPTRTRWTDPAVKITTPQHKHVRIAITSSSAVSVSKDTDQDDNNDDDDDGDDNPTTDDRDDRDDDNEGALSSTSEYIPFNEPLPSKSTTKTLEVLKSPRKRRGQERWNAGVNVTTHSVQPKTHVDARETAVLRESYNQRVRACTVIQAAWRGFYVRTTDYRCATARREIRSRRMEKHIILLSSDLEIFRRRILVDEEKNRSQQDAMLLMWQQLQNVSRLQQQQLLGQQHAAAKRIQTCWRAYLARKTFGPALRKRLLNNLSGTQRLRAAVQAGNTTALVELCLHLQEQVDNLNVRLTKATSANTPTFAHDGVETFYTPSPTKQRSSNLFDPSDLYE